MSKLTDIIALLDHWPAWKKIKNSPERIDALTARVAALEEAIKRAPGPKCHSCGGELELLEERPHQMFGEVGWKELVYKCAACGRSTTRELDPANE